MNGRSRPSIIEITRSVYGVPRALAWAIALYPIVSSLALTAMLAIPATKGRTYRLFLEDRLIENLTAVAYLLAAVLAVVMLLRLVKRRAARRQILTVGVLAVFCFFVGGEETSWGERMFHWKTLPIMKLINSQKENTVHNIRHLQPVNDWMPFALGAIGLWGVLRHTRRVRDAEGIPSILLTFFVVIVVFAGYDRLTDVTSIYFPVDLIAGRMGEYVEVLVALSFALGFALVLRRDGALIPGPREP